MESLVREKEEVHRRGKGSDGVRKGKEEKHISEKADEDFISYEYLLSDFRLANMKSERESEGMRWGKTHSMHNRNAAAVKIPRKKYQVKIPIENASIPLPPLSAHPYPALPTMGYLRQTVTNLTTKRYLFTAFFHASASLNAGPALQQRGRDGEREEERGGQEEEEGDE